ncbi:hypothetical protein Xaut_0533 [Xanthobacter versatilis]|uniref:Uncharacterized protein n=1 Tax=Xanthobacter autotrophicus (strain ATCC BAA-1158 / Py2) TaxID=78245 RepID=A7ICP6_XANP2|nr:hypothetical protein Xaut_0533 [Xanthobacter autotrophicus Py2]
MLSSSPATPEIAYSDDVLARMQAALIALRAATGVNGRKRSWAAIALDLQEFLTDPADLDDDDDENFTDPLKPLAEALRRFAAGTQVPAPDRLDGLCRLLVSKAFLTEMDLRPAAHGSALLHALTAYFGTGEQASPSRSRNTATRKTPGGRTELSVLTIAGEGNRPPAVEDSIYSLPIPPQSTDPGGLIRLMKRTGGSMRRFDGWLFRFHGQTIMVMQDSLKGEPAIYTVLYRKNAALTAEGVMIILKSRDFGFPVPEFGEKMRLFSGSFAEDALAMVKDRIWAYRQEGDADAR